MRLPTREHLRPRIDDGNSVTPSVRKYLKFLKHRFKIAHDDAVSEWNVHMQEVNVYMTERPVIGVFTQVIWCIHDSACKPGVANKLKKYWLPAGKVLQKLAKWTFKAISMAGREFVVNVDRMIPCLISERGDRALLLFQPFGKTG
jgi:hypothetical protein